MCRRLIVGLIAVAALAASQVAADMVITLEPKDADTNPITGPVEPGTQVLVDILVSATGDDSPLADLRGLQFDFAATSADIEISEFTWLLDPGISADFYLQFDTLPMPSATFVGLSGIEGMILNLDETPTRVASVTITVGGNGTLDAGASSPEGTATFNAGFDPRVDFSAAVGNLSGGTFDFTVPDPGGGGGGGNDNDNDNDNGNGDSDGDGVPDEVDQFPDDPEESVDTDDDGLGDNADEDDDGDGVRDVEDAFPKDPAETQDTDGDGIGNNTDIDDDGDSVFDVDDDLPLDPDEQTDTDGDGIGDNADPDDDGDGLLDADDPEPLTPADTGDGSNSNSNDGNTNVGSRASGGFCGLGMVGASMFILLGLSATRLHRRPERRIPGKR